LNTSEVKVLRRPVEFALDSVIGVDDPTWLGTPVADGHVERIDDQRGVLSRVDRPADDPPTEGVQHCCTEHFAFPRGMFGNVRDP
jgi:hypothetical protein